MSSVQPPFLATLGKYQLVRKLAVGGMAEVYLAKVAGPGGFEKTLVLKRVLPHLAADDTFISMFRSEAKLAAQLNHPNVVSIFDFGQEGDVWFLVMEFIDGPNLRALFRRAFEVGQPIAFNLAAKIISAACEGLAYAHEFIDPQTGAPMQLVHRDVSPDNILLAKNGGVKVVDFGIAKAVGQTHHTKTGTVKGKVAYMPPEQLRGEPLDCRVDVFALGIVLYELVAGVKPFDITTDAVIMQAILFQKFRPALERRPETPPELQRILDRALEKNREARYADCREFQADLERFIFSQGLPVGQHQLAQLVARLGSATAAGTATPSPRPSQPNPLPPPDVPNPGQISAHDISIYSATSPLLTTPEPATARPRSVKGVQIIGLVGFALAVTLTGLRWSSTRDSPMEPIAVAVAPPEPAPRAPPPAEVAPVAPVPPVTARPKGPARSPAARNPTPTVKGSPSPASDDLSQGSVNLTAEPQAVVRLLGKVVGTTPLHLELPEGMHRLELEYPSTGTRRRLLVNVVAGKETPVSGSLH